MWCENCKKSFENDEKLCPECGTKLIDYTPILDEDADLSGINEVSDALADELIENEEEIQIDIESTSQLLVTVVGEKEAKKTVDFLNENHFPASCKEAEEQTLDELEGIEWEDDFEDEVDDEFDDEEYEVETLTPPETEEEVLSFEETLYDIFVPEAQFPEAMSLMLEKDKDMDATIIDELAEVIPTEEEFVETFEEEPVVEEVEEIAEEVVEEVSEEPEKIDGEKSKGGFWNLFRK